MNATDSNLLMHAAFKAALAVEDAFRSSLEQHGFDRYSDKSDWPAPLRKAYEDKIESDRRWIDMLRESTLPD